MMRKKAMYGKVDGIYRDESQHNQMDLINGGTWLSGSCCGENNVVFIASAVTSHLLYNFAAN
jgi:hypothetical protein